METEMFNGIPDGAVYVRRVVFQKEQGFIHEFDEYDPLAVHFLIKDQGKPIGTCRVFQKNDSDIYILGRLAVLREYRGAHVGSMLIGEAEKYVRSVGGKEIQLHSQCTARSFYQYNGYVEYGEPEDEEGCPHIWMKKQLSIDK